MAQDGSYEVAWKGQAFPYLLHHQGFLRTENYGSERSGHGAAHGSHGAASHGAHGGYGAPRAAAHGSSDAMAPAGTGTWNGAAPRGWKAPSHASDAPAAAAPVNEPQTALLPSGDRMPMIGLGTYAIDNAQTITDALEIGYRHFDCAAFYGNEAVVGQGLAPFIASGRRSELFLTSKVWSDSHRPAALRASCEKSIKDLGAGYLDLYLIHWPEAWLPTSDVKAGVMHWDTEATIQQTWAAMEALVADGLVRNIGVSNFSLAQVEEVLGFAKVKPCVNQVEMHPLLAQRKLAGVCLRKGVLCTAYSPLGSQFSKELLNNATVAEVAKQAGKTPAQVLLKWNIQRGVPVIPKASSRAHLEANLKDMCSWKLTWQQKALAASILDQLDAGKRFITSPGGFTKNWGDVEEGGAKKPSVVFGY